MAMSLNKKSPNGYQPQVFGKNSNILKTEHGKINLHDYSILSSEDDEEIDPKASKSTMAYKGGSRLSGFKVPVLSSNSKQVLEKIERSRTQKPTQAIEQKLQEFTLNSKMSTTKRRPKVP